MNLPSRSGAFPLAVALTVACGTGVGHRLSHTWDEGIPLAAGLERLQDGRYEYQTSAGAKTAQTRHLPLNSRP